MFKKLRNHFLLMHMGVVSLLIALFFGSILLLTYSSLERSTDARLEAMNRARAVNVSVTIVSAPETETDWFFVPAPEPESDWFFTRTETPMSIRMGGAGMQMRTPPGIFITTDENGQMLSVMSAYAMDEAFYTHIAGAVRNSRRSAGKLRVGTVALKYNVWGNEIIFVDVTQETNLFFTMLRVFLLIALPLLGVIFWVSVLFARASIRPIESSYNRQKEFIADASHELKTPLAAISANMEVLAGSAAPEQKPWLGHIQSEVGRMAGLTDSLLYLARMDAAGPEAAMDAAPLDLGCLVSACLLPLEAVLFEKGIALSVSAAEGVTVQGDEEQLRRLVGILSDNALRYAGSAIDVTIERAQGYGVLTIANDGPGIAPDETKKIWERFYRCDRARLYDGGYGLGLPMARAITERHKGRITCESEPGIRTAFVVRLPISP